MPEVICNTSPLQYLHQVGQLQLLPALAHRVVVPPAVRDEIATGRRMGIDLPDMSPLDWIEIRAPVSAPALPLVTDLGPGETEVPALALESRDAFVVLDDALARRVAETLGLKITGTLGLLDIETRLKKTIEDGSFAIEHEETLKKMKDSLARTASLDVDWNHPLFTAELAGLRTLAERTLSGSFDESPPKGVSTCPSSLVLPRRWYSPITPISGSCSRRTRIGSRSL